MEQFISLLGIFGFFGLAYLLSVDRRAIRWRTVIWGFAIQFLFGVVMLLLPIGFTIFNALGNLVTTFLNFADVGAEFVYGETFKDHFFVFKVLSTTIFFSGVIGLLYYLGALQKLVAGIAAVMQRTMQTSGPETTSCSANIFIGQTEAPLLIRPFINQISLSELHAIMTGGFATVAGGGLAAFIGFGIPADQLIAASVMNAPGALAMSKIFFPQNDQFSYSPELDVELREAKAKAEAEGIDAMDLPRSAFTTATDPIAAVADGAIQGMNLAITIVAILLVFLSLIALFNAILGWFGGLFGLPQLSLELVLSYLLFPLAWIMGVPLADCQEVAVFLGKKIILNEFIAFADLAEAIKRNAISPRAAMIATFALCGFANISSIGQQIGAIGGLAPSRKNDVAQLGLRAMVAGSFTNFVSACIAGLLLADGR